LPSLDSPSIRIYDVIKKVRETRFPNFQVGAGYGGRPELLLQKTITLDYLTKYRMDNKNHTEQYRVENNHEGIVSKELWDMAQKEFQRRYEIYSGTNKDRSKHIKAYAFSESLSAGLRYDV